MIERGVDEAFAAFAGGGLGVFNFAQRILASLRNRYRSAKEVVDLLDQNEKVVKAAALLHDIGHGPFSHLMERAFPSLADHEGRTIDLIKAPESSLPHILSQAGIEPQAVCDLIGKTAPYRLLVDIVSSQLDADRMDYILRDALSTGVKYGAFDAEWLLNCLCIGSEPSAATPTPAPPQSWRLCLDEKRGLYSAEQLVIARVHMSLQVYFHKTTRAWEAHLLCLFKLAADLAAKDDLPGATSQLIRHFLSAKGKLGHQDFLLFDEAALTAAFQAWAAAAEPRYNLLSELSRGYLTRQKSFRHRDLEPLDFRKATKLQQEFAKHGRESIDWYLDEIKFNSYKDFGAVFKSTKQMEDEEQAMAVSTSAILLAGESLGSRSKPVESRSQLFDAMGGDPIKSIIRLYFHRSLESEVSKILASM